MQQWTNKQQVPGIQGNVDGNVFFGDVTAFKKYGYKAPVPTPDYKALYEAEVKAHEETKRNFKVKIEQAKIVAEDSAKKSQEVVTILS
jgi:hypothetical protein